MESYKSGNLRNPQEIEKNLDRIIIQRMRGESSHSPFKYSPKYQQDEFSRLILQGNRSIINPNPMHMANNAYLGDKYFNNVQHQYLNQENYYNRMWNINSKGQEGNIGKNKDNAVNQNHDASVNKEREDNYSYGNKFQERERDNSLKYTNHENFSTMSNRGSSLGSQMPTNTNNYSIAGRNSPMQNKFAEIGQKLMSTPLNNTGKSPDSNSYRFPGQGLNNYHYYNPGKY